MDIEYRNAAIQYLYARRRIFLYHTGYLGTVPQQVIEDALSACFLNMCRWIDLNYIPKHGLNPAIPPEEIPVGILRVFQKALAREIAKQNIKVCREAPVEDAQLEILIPQDTRALEMSIRHFNAVLNRRHRRLASRLKSELKFYLYFVNECLSEKQRIAIDAHCSGDTETVRCAIDKLGEYRYYKINSRLLNEGEFHRQAIKVARMLRRSGKYRKLGFDLGGLREVINALQEQLEEIEAERSSGSN